MPYYLILRGPLGCGKSTIAKKLSVLLGARVFAIDRVLDKHKLTKHKEEGYISQQSFLKANTIILPEAQKFLQQKVPVIFEGNFYWKSQINDLIRRLKYPHRVFTLTAPLKVCIERDAHRKKTHGKDAVMVVYKKSTEFRYGAPIRINQPLSKCIREILSKIPEKFRKR